MSNDPTTAKATPDLPAPEPETAPAPAPTGYARKLRTAVEVAEHETRLAAEQLERFAGHITDRVERTLRDLSIERNSPFDAGHGVRVSESGALAASASDFDRAVATYIAKRDKLDTLSHLLVEAQRGEAEQAP